MVIFILGGRAVSAARATRLSGAATRLFDAAPRHPERTGIRVEPVRARDLPLIRKPVGIKLEH